MDTSSSYAPEGTLPTITLTLAQETDEKQLAQLRAAISASLRSLGVSAQISLGTVSAHSASSVDRKVADCKLKDAIAGCRTKLDELLCNKKALAHHLKGQRGGLECILKQSAQMSSQMEAAIFEPAAAEWREGVAKCTVKLEETAASLEQQYLLMGTLIETAAQRWGQAHWARACEVKNAASRDRTVAEILKWEPSS